MDRTSRIGLAVCLILLIAIQFALDRFYPPAKKMPATAPTSLSTTPLPNTKLTGPSGPASAPGTTPPTAPLPQTFSYLENDAMKVTFTSAGAAITQIALKQQKSDNGGPVILNDRSQSNVMALAGWPGADAVSFQSQDVPNGMSFTATLPDGVQWQRTYTFGNEAEVNTGMTGMIRRLYQRVAVALGHPQPKPLVYTLDVTDTLTNPGAADITLPPYSLSVGRALPIYNPLEKWEKEPTPSRLNQQFVGSGWLTKSFHLTTVSSFNPGSIPIIGIKTSEAKDEFSSKTVDPASLRWIGVEDQFFTVLLTPADELPIDHGEFFCFSPRDPSSGYITREGMGAPDIEAAANFPSIGVQAGKSVTLKYGLYAGPKDFNRLDELGANQGELMNYGLFEILIVPMLTIL
jgi:hypothetical protein